MIDNEDHRLNHCKRFKEFNYYNNEEKVQFEKIFTNDVATLKDIIPKIEQVWNTRRAHGMMNQ